ncbi:hypothetical protein P43SY_001274 [Pythium insidiosum]|uniref:PPM-type phosphatase domain-containing protein n=1 Tax=Pythium insidiosum TaxID=114742 RepID=A0AAD5LER4_PYTIN|nr:hypothetical protein P43SY_001274 [Pythium insidiosum]
MLSLVVDVVDPSRRDRGTFIDAIVCDPSSPSSTATAAATSHTDKENLADDANADESGQDSAMGCIFTRVCCEDELMHNHDALLDDMDKAVVLTKTPTGTLPRLSRTATTMLSLEPLASKGGKKRAKSTSNGSSTSSSAVYGGGIPGVALDDSQADSPEYTGAVPGGYTSHNNRLRWGGHSRAGNDPLRRRKENQDSFSVTDCFADDSNATFFAVLDGHGPEGASVSQFVREVYPEQLAAAFRELVIAPKSTGQRPLRRGSVATDVLGETFQLAAQRVSEELTASALDISVSGSTAVGLLVLERDVFVANVGDSRAIVAVFSEADGRYVIRHETKDHKPELPEERQRIEAQNGRVFEWGTCRVWLQDVDMPGLAMSRSFGDSIAKTIGVTSEPAVVFVDRVPVGDKDHPSFAVLASDGVWEFMSSEECLTFVSDCILTAKMTPQQAVDALVTEATERWNMEEDVVDDITAVIVYF